MRVLLVHPEDDPTKGLSSGGPWDRVVDFASTSNVVDVERLPGLGCSDFGRIRNALAFGTGVLVDSQGIDWWELLSIEFHQWLEKLQVLRRFAATMGPGDEIFATRPGCEFSVLQAIERRELQYLSRAPGSRKGGRGRVQQLLKVGPKRVLEILGDKYDSGYRLRRLFSPVRPRLAGQVVLAPSSYVNASRGVAAYASVAPETEFLLVATRANGLLKELPRNVHSARLACYALSDENRLEMLHMFEAWGQLKARLTEHEDWSVLNRLGVLENMPSLLRNGIRVRDAWRNVFESADVRAVLCGDEMNPLTRLPVCIARQRGITALAFHHGALDGRYRYRDNSADLMLAKSKMEIDYLVNECGVAEEKIALGAVGPHEKPRITSGTHKSAIVFFSEPYEIVGGRCSDVYRQVLPALRGLARERDRELILKLHPQENRREREPIAAAAIGRDEFRVIERPLASDLLDRSEFAVTVSSTAAVDCSQRGIPAFLCAWLDRSHYKYGEHFVKFGSAIPLRGPEEIAAIPELAVSHSPAMQTEIGDSAIQGVQFRQLLDGVRAESAAKVKLAEPAWA